jgi:hypothetical protein
MTKFVHIDHSTQHLGVDRLENAVSYLKTSRLRLDSSRDLASLLLAAIVAALLVVANQVIDSITDGHLLAAWIGLWVVGFAAMALLAQPASLLIRKLRDSWSAWRAERRAIAENEKLWSLALHDRRVMAELQAAMARS